MGIENDLEKAMKEGYWIEVIARGHFSTCGKVKEIEKEPDGVLRLCPYYFSSSPYAEKGSTDFYFKKIEDKAIAMKKKDIVAILPIPDDAVKLMEEVANKLLKEKDKKVGIL